MKFWRMGMLMAAGLPLVCAAQSQFVNDHMSGESSLHPTVIFTEYDKNEEMIIDVHGDEPEVEVNHKRHSIYRDTNYLPMRGPMFAPGSVQVFDEHADSRFTEVTYYMAEGGTVSGGEWDHHSDYETKLLPTQSYKDCYIAVLFFDAAFLKGREPVPKISIAFQGIGDLTAGKTQKVRMRFKYMDPSKTQNVTFFPLIFTRGVEIQSNHSKLSAVFFRRLELNRHENLIADYKAKNAGKDMPLKPYVRSMPKFPDDLDLSKLPATVKTSFMVDGDGMVYSVQIEDQIDPQAEKAIRQALHGWLFLPRLKDGRAERTMVRLPIQVHPAEAVATGK